MQMRLNTTYKSLHPFICSDMPKLIIITGINGSGKTQLLNLIYTKYSGTKEGLSIDFQIQPSPKRIQFEGLQIKQQRNFIYKIYQDKINTAIGNYKSHSQEYKQLLSYLVDNNIVLSQINSGKDELISDDIDYIRLAHIVYCQLKNTAYRVDKIFTKSMEKDVLTNIIFNKDIINTYRIISKYKNIPIHKITETDFHEAPIQDQLFENFNIFENTLEAVFYAYAAKRDINRKQFFYKKEDGEDNNSIPDNEFIRKFPPPWEIINNILREYKFDLKFEAVEPKGFRIESNYQVNLLKISMNESLSFENLSTGENVFLGLIIKLFSSEYYIENLKLPDLLLLDEPDAFLHPSLTKSFISIIENYFIKNHNINVILTTHSPTTIALSPEKSIYTILNGPRTELIKTDKDLALKKLLQNVPTLSLDYKNHRQIFVESPTDIEYYQNVYNAYIQHNISSHKLYFISLRGGKGNSNTVISLVKNVREAGNMTFFGLIDWDLINSSSEFTFVHGENDRYSVENYLLDPIYLIVLLLNLNAHNIYSDLSLTTSFNQYLIGDLDNKKLQSFAEYIIDKIISTKRLPLSEIKTVNYLNNKSINLPKWYTQMRGHDLESIIKQAFPALSKYRNEGELQKELSIIISKCYPFIPLSTFNAISHLCNN